LSTDDKIAWYEWALRVVERAVECSRLDISTVVSGTANGFDKAGEEWASRNGRPVKRFPARWSDQGKSAGAIRNRNMANYADGLIALTYGTPGTANMIETMRKQNKPVRVTNLRPEAWLE